MIVLIPAAISYAREGRTIHPGASERRESKQTALGHSSLFPYSGNIINQSDHSFQFGIFLLTAPWQSLPIDWGLPSLVSWLEVLPNQVGDLGNSCQVFPFGKQEDELVFLWTGPVLSFSFAFNALVALSLVTCKESMIASAPSSAFWKLAPVSFLKVSAQGLPKARHDLPGRVQQQSVQDLALLPISNFISQTPLHSPDGSAMTNICLALCAARTIPLPGLCPCGSLCLQSLPSSLLSIPSSQRPS